MTKAILLAGIFTAFVLLSGGLANSAFGLGYMKLGDIKGESTDEGHKDWIEISSISQSIDQNQRGKSARSGDASFGDIAVSKSVDVSTPKLQEAIATGKNFPNAEIHLLKAGTHARQVPYLTWELKNVQVTSYSLGGSTDNIPQEQISLNFEEIKVTYSITDETGKVKQDVYVWKITTKK